MIIGDNRKAVIENIKRSAENGDFYAKVELNDPVLQLNNQMPLPIII